MAFQGRANGELARITGLPLQAATISMIIGLFALLLGLGVPGLRAGLGRLREAWGWGRIRWWYLTSGAFGALLLVVQSWVVPELGVAMFTIAFVAGQAASALLIDRFNLGPGIPRPIRPLRVASAGLAIAGVALATAGSGPLALALVPMLACLVVGGTNMLQQAWNGRVGLATNSVFTATLGNFAVGAVALLLLLLVQGIAGHPPVWPIAAPWWAWTGGVLGVVFIAVGAWAVRHVGILVFAVTSLLGNVGAAVLLDLLSPAHEGRFGLLPMTGVLITFAAATLATWAARPSN